MHLLWLYYTAIVKERTSALIYCVAIAITTVFTSVNGQRFQATVHTESEL